MALLPATLPIWAYLAAGGAAFAAAKVAGSAGGGTTAPVTAQPASTADQSASSDLWGAYGDQGTQFGAGGSIGYVGGGDSSAGGSNGGWSLTDLLGGQPLPVTLTDALGNAIDFGTGGAGSGGSGASGDSGSGSDSGGGSAPAPSGGGSAPAATGAPSAIGPRPAGAIGYVIAAGLPSLYTYSGGVARKGGTGSLTFKAWNGPSKTLKTTSGQATFRQVLSGPHHGLWIHTSDAGVSWHSV